MTGRVFVDSNILIYAHDAAAGAKRLRADVLTRTLWSENRGRLSTQVLQEFYSVVTRKIGSPLSPSLAREVVRDFSQWVTSLITPATVIRASEIGEAWQLSFWDSMILASAEQSGAHELWTEDLQHGAVIAGVRIVNPFLETID